MQCLKLCTSMPGQVQVKITKFLMKWCLTNDNTIWIFHFSEILKCTLNCIFQIWTFPHIKLILGHHFYSFSGRIPFRTVNTFLNIYKNEIFKTSFTSRENILQICMLRFFIVQYISTATVTYMYLFVFVKNQMRSPS